MPEPVTLVQLTEAELDKVTAATHDKSISEALTAVKKALVDNNKIIRQALATHYLDSEVVRRAHVAISSNAQIVAALPNIDEIQQLRSRVNDAHEVLTEAQRFAPNGAQSG